MNSLRWPRMAVLIAVLSVACTVAAPSIAMGLVPAPQLSADVRTAVGSTRTFEWDIAKTVDVSAFDLNPGETARPNYTVMVTKGSGTDGDYTLVGTIAIHNPAAVAATVTAVTVNVIGANRVPVTGAFPQTIPAGGQATVTFEQPVDGPDQLTLLIDVATVGTVRGNGLLAFALYEGPTHFVNDSVTVADSMAGALGTLSDSGTFPYSIPFDYTQAGVWNNVATIAETGQSARAAVTIRAIAPASRGANIDTILTTFDAACVAGTLEGVGPGKSAANRLQALRNMLAASARLMAGGRQTDAHVLLQDALAKCDGLSTPPDFIAGPARAELAGAIGELIQGLGK